MLASVVLRFSHEPLGDAELPPRARRIPIAFFWGEVTAGTTSACAENTPSGRRRGASPRNYLRVRGEYGHFLAWQTAAWELPPRARRILSGSRGIRPRAGTTSACAENTSWRRGRRFGWRNYLRVRGEYIPRASERPERGELPPRARRIRDRTVLVDVAHGTTSACAENTDFLDSAGDVGGNYLRVRGEYTCHACARAREWELPPRARRIHNVFLRCQCNPGTTSACAENTIGKVFPSHGNRNYLRVRGEYPAH